MISLGIDPSTSATGFVVLKAETKVHLPEVLHKSASVHKDKKGHARQSAIAADMLDILNAYHPDKVVIEGYGLNFKHTSSVVPLVELGGLLRYFLIQMGYHYLDPRPGQHKGYITGNGQSPKAKVTAFVKKRWGFNDPSNDIVDAYGLGIMGLAHGGMIMGMTQEEREIIASIKLRTEHG